MSGVLLLDYPEVTLEEVTSQAVLKQEELPSQAAQAEEKEEKSLHSPYPAWLLTPEGIVVGANLLSAWLWEVPHLSDLLGSNVGTIFSKNFGRIPKHKNGEFYTKKTGVVKRLISRFGIHHYHHYLDGLKADTDLWKIYEKGEWLQQDEWETNREWQYPLRILPPGGKNPDELLEFQVTVSRLKDDAGFFVIGKPHPKSYRTQSLVQKKYNNAQSILDMIKYVQFFDGIKRGDKAIITKEHVPELRSELHRMQENLKAIREEEIDSSKYIGDYHVWEVLLEWALEAEQRGFKDVEVEAPEGGGL